MSTLLYNVLSGLHKSDTLLSSTITTLSGKVSPAFSSTGELTIGAANGITKSTYTLPADDTTLANVFGAANKVASEINAKRYVDAQISAANAAALTGATFNDAISGTVDEYDGGKHITIGVKVDDKTVKVSGGVLSAALTLSAVTAGSGYASAYELVDAGGTSHGRIDIPKDQFLKDAAFGYAEDAAGTNWDTARLDPNRTKPVLKLTFDISKSADGGQTATEASNDDKVVYVDLTGLIHVYKQGTGITISDDTISWNPTAGNGIGINGATISAQLNATDDNDGFLKLNANGLYTSGIKQFVNDTTSAMVTAPSDFAAANQIILANDNKKAVKSSGVSIVSGANGITDVDTTIPTSKAVSGFVATKTAKMVEADATLTADQFVLGNGNKTVKTTGLTLASGYNGITDVDTTIPTSKAVSGLVSGAIATANAKNVTAETEWSTSGKLVVTDGASGRKIKQSDYTVETTGAVTSSNNAATSIPTNATIWASISGLVTGPATATGNNIATFDGDTGKIIKDSGKAFSTAAVSSDSTNNQIPTALAVYASISGFVAPSGSGFADNHIALFADTTGRKIKDSAQTITTDAPTSSSTSGTIPTSNAVWSAISGFVTGSGLTADKIVLGNGDQKVKTSSIGIAESMTDDSDHTIVPTAKAVAAYVTDQLADLKSQIEALNTAISNLNS